ncbi:MAG TPA: hypothetical protein VNQ76_01910 [Planctomicrobium sp.]|nr:hypothetical protein [Planctomicrobium sp.]
MSTPTPSPPGLIDRNAIYTASEFCRRMGIGNHAWRSLKRQGLPVTRLAKRAYVRGDQFFDWLASRTEGGQS